MLTNTPAIAPRTIVANDGARNAALELSGSTPVAEKPRYHDPISVSFPFPLRNAAFAPTFELVERKAPKYE
jgi:hypothetical protein